MYKVNKDGNWQVAWITQLSLRQSNYMASALQNNERKANNAKGSKQFPNEHKEFCYIIMDKITACMLHLRYLLHGEEITCPWVTSIYHAFLDNFLKKNQANSFQNLMMVITVIHSSFWKLELQTDRWMNRWKFDWLIDRWMDGWIDECLIDRQMDGWMDGRMDKNKKSLYIYLAMWI